MLSEFLKEERKQVLNREWKYLSPLQRNIIFARFILSILPIVILRTWQNHLLYKRAQYAYSYPAHWV